MKRTIVATISVCVFLFFLVGCDQIPGVPDDEEIIAAISAIFEAIEEVLTSGEKEPENYTFDRPDEFTEEITFMNYEVDGIEFKGGVTIVKLNGTVTRTMNGKFNYTMDIDCESNDFSKKLSMEITAVQEFGEDLEVKVLKVNGAVIDFDAFDD